MAANTLIGKGRDAVALIIDEGTFEENITGGAKLEQGYGPGAVVGTGKIAGRPVTVISNDAKVLNPRFPVVYGGVIGLEEGYKMAMAVYCTIENDLNKKDAEKTPIILLIDSPGNGPGKLEEIAGMNKATGAYQLALGEARQNKHPVIGMIIGRAISGAFLCHGLQADRILSLTKDYGTMIHVMPLSSIARITKLDVEHLEALSKTNPVFASGAEFFYRLGGVEELIESPDLMKGAILRHIEEVCKCHSENSEHLLGPRGRGELGAQRGGRTARKAAIEKMRAQFAQIEERYL